MLKVRIIMLRMIGILSILLFSVFLSFSSISEIFSHSPIVNVMIMLFFSLGAILCFRNVLYAGKDLDFLKVKKNSKNIKEKRPKILSCVDSLGDIKEGNWNFLKLQGALSSIQTRLDDLREVPRYTIGLLVFLGLFGTLIGLSKAIGSISGLINSIGDGAGDLSSVIEKLKTGLQNPIHGMGTAFGCSLFGLTGSIILGLLDLHVSKAFSEFFHRVEENLNYKSKLGSDIYYAAIEATQTSGTAFNMALLDKVIESLSLVDEKLKQNEDNKTNILIALQSLTKRLNQMGEIISEQQDIIKKIAQMQLENQTKVKDSIQVDEGIAKQYLRSIDTSMIKILEELSDGRQKMTQELKSEIRLVSRTISSLAEEAA